MNRRDRFEKTKNMFTRKNREPSTEGTEIRNNATGKEPLAKGVITPFITLKNLILDNTWVGLAHGILVLFSIIAMPHSQSIAGPRYEPIWSAPLRGYAAIPDKFADSLETVTVVGIYMVIISILPFGLIAYFTAKMKPGRDGIRSLTILAILAIALHGLHAYTHIVYRVNPLTAAIMLTLLLYVPVVGITESLYARTLGRKQNGPRRREKDQPHYNRITTTPEKETAAKAQPDPEPAKPAPKPAPPPRRPRAPAEPPPTPRAARPPASPLGQ